MRISDWSSDVCSSDLVVSDQNAEIDRMNVVLAGLSSDPRATLAAGFRDAGQAISNLRLVTAMPKASGFFDPENPAQLQPEIAAKDDQAKDRSEEHTSELQSLMRISNAVFCLKKKTQLY